MKAAPTPLKGIRIGVMEQVNHSVIDSDVARAVREAALQLEELGATVYPINIFKNWPDSSNSQDKLRELLMCTAAYYTIASVEACSNLARFDGIRYSGDNELINEHFSSETDRLVALRSSMFGPEVCSFFPSLPMILFN